VDKETYQGVTYDLTRNMFTFAIQPTGAFRLALDGQVGDDIDVANARPATLVRLAPSLEWKVGKPLNVQVSHTFERLSVDGGRLLHRQPHPAQGRLSLQRPHLRPRDSAVHGRRAERGAVRGTRLLVHAAAVFAVPVLLQVQSQDRAAPRLSDNSAPSRATRWRRPTARSS